MPYNVMFCVSEEGVMRSKLVSGKSYEYEQSFCTDPDTVGRFKMYQMGEVTCEPGYICDTHHQWCYEITFVISGEGINTVDGVDTVVKEGDVYLTPLNSNHKIRAITRFRYMFIGFGIARNDTEDMALIDAFYAGAPRDILKGDNDLMLIFNRCFDEYYNRKIANRLMIESLIAQLVIHVMRYFIDDDKKSLLSSEKKEVVGISIYAVKAFIDENICTLGNIADIAKKHGYNPAYLSSSFKKQMGMTLRHYIAGRRIEESIRLVRDLGMSISDAAAKVGFATPQAYSKAFKRNKGVSPMVFFADK